MALPLDLEEPVVLSRHGVMTLRSAVARAMVPDERDAAIIIRKGQLSEAILNFELIKELAARLARE